MVEQDVAPAGVPRKHALGRRRGSTRWPIRAARQELADGGRPQVGGPPQSVPGRRKENAAMARREAPAFLRGNAARQKQWLRHLARHPPLFSEGYGKRGLPGASTKNTGDAVRPHL